MLVTFSMKFHEDTLNGFKVIERTRFCHRNCYLNTNNTKGTVETELKVTQSALDVHMGCTPFVKD